MVHLGESDVTVLSFHWAGELHVILRERVGQLVDGLVRLGALNVRGKEDHYFVL